MTSILGLDNVTYYYSGGFSNDTTNDTNYCDVSYNSESFYNFTANINTFTNNYIILATGGSIGGGNGGHGILNNSGYTITSLYNYGSLLGGGGGGGAGGDYNPGGAGGGGGSAVGGVGRSLINNLVNGGGGPGQDGGPSGSFLGGKGRGEFGGSGAGNSNGGDSLNAGSSVFIFGGGGAAFAGGGGGQYNAGGGGYGGGNGGGSSNRSGGGGGGGGSGGGTGANPGGNGGYSIYNIGTITNLYNSQGGKNNIYGPLFYTGKASSIGSSNLPTNYYIRLDSLSRYGQLYYSGWASNATENGNAMKIDIDRRSLFLNNNVDTIQYNFGGSFGNSVTFPNVFYNIAFTTIPSGILFINKIAYSWNLVKQTTRSDGINVYDLIIYAKYTCFKENTQILTNYGYKFIQNLKIGDFVKTTLNGYKPIFNIGKMEIYHPAIQERVQNQLYICKMDNFPELFENLVITGCHSLLIEEFKDEKEREDTIKTLGRIFITDDRYRLPACIDERTSVYENPGYYTVYHIALECDDYFMNYGIYANGLLVETCSKRYLMEYSNMTLLA